MKYECKLKEAYDVKKYNAIFPKSANNDYNPLDLKVIF